MAKQLLLIKDPKSKTKLWWIQKRHNYGGSLNYRKVARPFDSKKLVHTVFKAKLGKGTWFTRWEKEIGEILKKTAIRYQIKLQDFAINKDHIHVVSYTKNKDNQIKFLRFFSAEMGRRYKRILKRFGFKENSIWIARPFTRLVSWGRKSREILKNYLKKNRDEAMGFIAYTPRKHALSGFLARWAAQFDPRVRRGNSQAALSPLQAAV